MATKTLDVRTQISRDTSANWTKYDPVLLDGEIIIVDTAEGEVRYKVGNGTKKYSQLPFDDEAVKALISAKSDDSAVVHKTGNETVAGDKTFSGKTALNSGFTSKSNGNAVLNVGGIATDTDYIDMYVSGGSNAKRPLVLQNNSSGSGTVGIGTATPSEKLEVVGHVKATKVKGDGSDLTNVPYPVTSVAGKTGAVTLAASDVGAQPKITVTGILQGDGNGNITAVESIGAEVVTLNKSDVGLGNVDNTSDANKPISNATQAALNDKQSKITANGILKGDGTGAITAAEETEV